MSGSWTGEVGSGLAAEAGMYPDAFTSASPRGHSGTRPVRWGILSTAKIATQKVIPALRQSGLLEVVAIASRSLADAEAAASSLGIARAYGSYEALLADPDIEAIYNPLPNHLHVPLSLAAARAGKHVLCEKPMALNAAELEALRPFATQVHLREAFMVRHHPQWLAVREQVRRGEIGTLRTVQVSFSYFNLEPHNIRNRADTGGGALYDIGCYAVVAGRWFHECEPERVIAAFDRDPAFGTDRGASGLLDFGAGRQLLFSVSTQSLPYQRIQLLGSQGRIEIEVPFNAPPGEPTRCWTDRRGALDGSSLETATMPVADQYRLQFEAFSRAVRDERPNAAGLDDAQANLRVLDALFASEHSGRFERPGQ